MEPAREPRSGGPTRSWSRPTAVGALSTAAALYGVRTLAEVSGPGWSVLLAFAGVFAAAPLPLLRVVALLYAVGALGWSALEYLDAIGPVGFFDHLTFATLALSGVAALALAAESSTRPTRPHAAWALAAAPIAAVLCLGWAHLPVEASVPAVRMPESFRLEQTGVRDPLRFDVTGPVIAVDRAGVDADGAADLLAAFTLPFPVFATDGALLGRCDRDRPTVPGLSVYSWDKEGDRYVGTVSVPAARAGRVACDDRLASRLTERLGLDAPWVDERTVGGRLTLVVGGDTVVDRIEITQPDGSAQVLLVQARG